MTTALVTGASAGLGAEYAAELARRGNDLVLVARDRARLAALADSLSHAHGVRAEILVADLSRSKGREAVVARVSDDEKPIDLVVNNAGYGLGDRGLRIEAEVHEAALDVMVRTVLVVSYAAAEAMVKRGRGAILNVSSIAAYLPRGPYSAHKAWVKVFTEALSGELRGTGVTATAVLPGLVRTEFHERAHMDVSRFPRFMWLTPPQVVRPSLRAVDRGRAVVTPTFRYRLLMGVTRAIPRPLLRRASGV